MIYLTTSLISIISSTNYILLLILIELGEAPHTGFYKWLKSPHNLQVFAENIDSILPGLNSMPTGFTPFEFPERDPDILLHYMRAMKLFPGFGKLSERNFCVSFQNRINHSAERPIVRKLCNYGPWKPFCRDFNTGGERYKNTTWDKIVANITGYVRHAPVRPSENWRRSDSHFFEIAHCQFVLCVHGGGVDPSPKVCSRVSF